MDHHPTKGRCQARDVLGTPCGCWGSRFCVDWAKGQWLFACRRHDAAMRLQVLEN